MTPLLDAARRGDAAALRQASMIADYDGDNKLSLHLLHHAAHGGDLFAQMLLGDRLLKSDPKQGEGWLRLAADAGHPLAVLRVQTLNIKDAPLSKAEAPGELPEKIWPRLAAVNLQKPRPTRGEKLSERPWVTFYKKYFSMQECAYMQALAARYLRVSDVIDPKSGKVVVDPYRTGLNMQFVPALSDAIIANIDYHLARLTKTPVENGEALSILVYRPNEQYRPHWDHLVDTAEESLSRLKASGQRLYTALITLDDGFEGGETAFTETTLKVKGGVGDVVVFRNLDEAGQPDPMTMHAGLPVTKGIKWLASKWIRERAFVN